MIDWSKVLPADFERLCAELLEANGFSNVQWFGRSGGDKGRDILATKFHEPLPGIQRQQNWIIQCERYLSRPPNKNEIESFLISAKEHSPDCVLLITTATLTPDVKDWVKAIGPHYPFQVFVWEKRDLEREVGKNRNSLTIDLNFDQNDKDPILFFQSPPIGKVYTCNQVEEIGFFILNDYGNKQNIEYIQEFIRFIRENKIVFENEE